MGVRLDPSDEYMHPLGPEKNFNESMYINCFDPANKVGGWFRMGNRANEGYAEMTVCIYLPDGSVGFMFKRPNIENNDQLDAGGLTWTMVKPFEELRIDFTGKVVVLDGGTLEHERHRAIGQINAHRHLGVALVGAVAHAEPAADLVGRVETVDVHALVEVRLGAELVHVFVFRIQSYAHVVRVVAQKRVSCSQVTATSVTGVQTGLRRFPGRRTSSFSGRNDRAAPWESCTVMLPSRSTQEIRPDCQRPRSARRNRTSSPATSPMLRSTSA